METENAAHSEEVLTAPPTVAAVIPPRPPSWPAAIGVIAIVFASLAMLGGLWGFVVSPIMGAMARIMPPGGPNPFAGLQDMQAVIIISSAFTLLIGGLLLIGGIGLARRRRWAVRVLIVWAVIKMAFAIVNAVLGYQVQQAQMAAMNQSGAPGLNMPPGFMALMASVGLGLGMAWAWALPVFMLIWFARGKIKAEVAVWS